MAGALRASSTYQKLWREGFAEGFAPGFTEGRAVGQIEGAGAVLLRIGTRRLGPPPPAIRITIDQLQDLSALDQVVDRVTEATSWDDLGLDAPES